MYKEYAELKALIGELELREEILKKQILEDLHERGQTKVEGEYGIFTVVSKKRWKYSSKLIKYEEDLKIKKLEEQERGVAKAEIGEYIKFTTPDDFSTSDNGTGDIIE